jgi:hypothetical protein
MLIGRQGGGVGLHPRGRDGRAIHPFHGYGRPRRHGGRCFPRYRSQLAHLSSLFTQLPCRPTNLSPPPHLTSPTEGHSDAAFWWCAGGRDVVSPAGDSEWPAARPPARGLPFLHTQQAPAAFTWPPVSTLHCPTSASESRCERADHGRITVACTTTYTAIRYKYTLSWLWHIGTWG